MTRIQRCSNVRTVAQFFKEKKTAAKLQQRQERLERLQKQQAEELQKQQAAELKLMNYIRKTAKEILGNRSKYQVKANKSNTFQFAADIPSPGESLWAPWSPSYKGKK